MKARNLIIACLTAASGIATHEVQAQNGVLEEIVVTAQKRAENLNDVPVSVSVLASGDLEGLHLRDTTEISAQIPNLHASAIAGDSMPIFSLRGVSMNDFSLNQNSPVAVYVDEVYKGSPALQGVQIYDLERIEVLRGPQGTLYGKNSTGGAINFNTRKPVNGTEAFVQVGIGDYARKEAEAMVNFELGDQVAVRLAGTWTEADGWQENVNPGIDDGSAIDEYGIRFSLLWDAAENVEILFRTSRSESNAVNYGIVPDQVGPGGVGAGIYGLYNALGATTRIDGTRHGLDTWEFESGQDLDRELENTATALTINWEVGNDLVLTSVSSYDKGENFIPEDADGTVNTVIHTRQGSEATQVSQDFRMTSEYDSAFNFIAGVYYSREKIEAGTTLLYVQDLDLNLDGALDFTDCTDPLFLSLGAPELVTPAGLATDALFIPALGFGLGALAGFGCQTQNDFEQKRRSTAAYFDGSYKVSDQWTLRLGLRYTRDETELSDFSARYLGNDDIPILATIPLDDTNPYATLPDRQFTDREVTGKIGLDYTTDNNTLVYASYSHGYRAGTFNAQAYQDVSEVTEVEPETLDALEVGLKATLLEERMQLNAAAFFYVYQNQQFLNIDQNLIQTLINIDESEITGFEIEARMLATESLTLSAGLGFIDSEVTKGILSDRNLDGNTLPQSPDVNFNLALDWAVYSSEAGLVTLHLDTAFTDEQFYEVANTDHTEVDSYWVTNARVTLESAHSSWAFSLWVKNLCDEKYQTSVLDLQGFFGYNYTHVGAPRTYGADFTYRF